MINILPQKKKINGNLVLLSTIYPKHVVCKIIIKNTKYVDSNRKF